MSTFDEFEIEVDPAESELPARAPGDEKGLFKVNIGQEKQSARQKFQAGWSKYADKIVLAAGIIVIAAISFEAGFLKGQKNLKEPVVVNQIASAGSGNGSACPTAVPPADASPVSPSADNQKCAYIASKNSNKYHLSTCQFAQKIKAENRVCFSSAEEAQKRGYQGAKCCIK